MKHSAIAFTALAVLLAMGCQKTETKTISVNVKVDETKLKEAGIDSPETYEVKLSNFSTGVSVQAKTENGIATAAGLVPGVYNVTVGASQNVGGFSYTIAGAQSNVSLLKDGDEVVVSVDAVKEAALVFKEIYYTGFSSISATSSTRFTTTARKSPMPTACASRQLFTQITTTPSFTTGRLKTRTNMFSHR